MMKTRLEQHYLKTVQPNLIKQFNYVNKFQVPKLNKIVINKKKNAVKCDYNVTYNYTK